MEKVSFLEKTFKLKKHDTNIKTEIMAGITTFMTMSSPINQENIDLKHIFLNLN